VRARWTVSHAHHLGVRESGGVLVRNATAVAFGCRASPLVTRLRVELQRRVRHNMWSPVVEWDAPADGSGRARCGHTHALDPAIASYWTMKALVVGGMECNRPANTEYALQVGKHNGRPQWTSAPMAHSHDHWHLFYTTGAFGGAVDAWVIATSPPAANLTGVAGLWISDWKHPPARSQWRESCSTGPREFELRITEHITATTCAGLASDVLGLQACRPATPQAVDFATTTKGLDEDEKDTDEDGVLDTLDVFPQDPTEWVDTDDDGVGNNADGDDDGDAVEDNRDDLPLDPTETVDTDDDGIGDREDTDDDGDGVADVDDDLPLDASETVDTDGDRLGDNVDTDDDGDEVFDWKDDFVLDPTESVDTDGDRVGNNVDDNDDGDSATDAVDLFPLDPAEVADMDSDSLGDNHDPDADGDSVPDVSDAFRLDPTESLDTDGDKIGNNEDENDDGDAVVDEEDHLPLISTETIDTDGDQIGDNEDENDDDDFADDGADAFPVDFAEWRDTDGDRIGDNADPDDDGDSVADAGTFCTGTATEVQTCDLRDTTDGTDACPAGCDSDAADAAAAASCTGTSATLLICDMDTATDGTSTCPAGCTTDKDALPLDATETTDTDSDGLGNGIDNDDDGDSVSDLVDQLPTDPTEQVDSDGDQVGNNADPDDDNDGTNDADDDMPLDPAEVLDTDGDLAGDSVDGDDDGDGFADLSDAFPLDATEFVDTDGDGVGDNADPDDDNDGRQDAGPCVTTHTICTGTTAAICDMDVGTDGTGGCPAGCSFDHSAAASCMGTATVSTCRGKGTDACPTGCTSQAFSVATTCTDTADGSSSTCDAIVTEAECGRVGGTWERDEFPLDPTEWKDHDSDGLGNNKDSCTVVTCDLVGSTDSTAVCPTGCDYQAFVPTTT
jgi:hypothetical protein